MKITRRIRKASSTQGSKTIQTMLAIPIIVMLTIVTIG